MRWWNKRWKGLPTTVNTLKEGTKKGDCKKKICLSNYKRTSPTSTARVLSASCFPRVVVHPRMILGRSCLKYLPEVYFRISKHDFGMRKKDGSLQAKVSFFSNCHLDIELTLL